MPRFKKTKKSLHKIKKRQKRRGTYKRTKPQRGGQYTATVGLYNPVTTVAIEEQVLPIGSMKLDVLYAAILNAVKNDPTQVRLFRLSMNGTARLYIYNCELREWLRSSSGEISEWSRLTIPRPNAVYLTHGFFNSVIDISPNIYVYISEHPPNYTTPIHTFCPTHAPVHMGAIGGPTEDIHMNINNNKPHPKSAAPVHMGAVGGPPVVPSYIGYPDYGMEGYMAHYKAATATGSASGKGSVAPTPQPPAAAAPLEFVRYAISAHGEPGAAPSFRLPDAISLAFFTLHGDILTCPNVLQTAVCAGTQEGKVKQIYPAGTMCKNYFLTPDQRRDQYGFYSGVVECNPGGKNEVIHNIQRLNPHGVQLQDIVDIIYNHHQRKYGPHIPARVYCLFCRGDKEAPPVDPGWNPRR